MGLTQILLVRSMFFFLGAIIHNLVFTDIRLPLLSALPTTIVIILAFNLYAIRFVLGLLSEGSRSDVGAV